MKRVSKDKKLVAVFALALITIQPAYGDYEDSDKKAENNVVCEIATKAANLK